MVVIMPREIIKNYLKKRQFFVCQASQYPYAALILFVGCEATVLLMIKRKDDIKTDAITKGAPYIRRTLR
jgi:hypothetical protein